MELRENLPEGVQIGVRWEVVRNGFVIQSGGGHNTANTALFNAIANYLGYALSTKHFNRVSVVKADGTVYEYCTLTLGAQLTPPPYGRMFSGSHTATAVETVAELNLIYYDGVSADVEYCTYTVTPALVMAIGDILNFTWTVSFGKKTGDEGSLSSIGSVIKAYFEASVTSTPVTTALITGTGGSPYTKSVSLSTPTVSSGTIYWTFSAKNESGADDTIASVAIQTAAGTAYFTKSGLTIDWDNNTTRYFTFQWVDSAT